MYVFLLIAHCYCLAGFCGVDVCESGGANLMRDDASLELEEGEGE